VLAYLSRYTHRVAISSSRLIAFDKTGVTFRYKDYRRDGADRQQVMTLAPHEFIRRFLLHVLQRGFHRIWHYGLLAGSARKAGLALARKRLDVVAPPNSDGPDEQDDYGPPCPSCGGRMIVIEMFERWRQPRGPLDATVSRDHVMTWHGVGQQVHVGYGMLEAGGDERGDRQQQADELLRHRIAGMGEPHRQTDEHVGKHAAGERCEKTLSGFRCAQLESGTADRAFASLMDTRREHKRGEQQRAGEIGTVDDCQRPCGPSRPDPSGRYGSGHQRVAREQFRPGDQH